MSEEADIADALCSAVSALQKSALVTGKLPAAVVAILRSNVLRELGRPAASLIGSRSVAFVSDAHLHYPDDVQEAEVLGRSSTTIIQNLNRSSKFFSELASHLGNPTYARISFSAYVSENQSSSLGNHRDAWDNIVIQLSGSKIFHFRSADDKLLRPGDYLTIPQNIIHRVSTPEQSMHLSIVMLKQFTALPRDSRA